MFSLIFLFQKQGVNRQEQRMKEIGELIKNRLNTDESWSVLWLLDAIKNWYAVSNKFK